MPDITMCANPENCPKAGTCYRVTATPSLRQPYADFFKAGEDCGYYWAEETRTGPTAREKEE